jgi:hypothetical protein
MDGVDFDCGCNVCVVDRRVCVRDMGICAVGGGWLDSFVATTQSNIKSEDTQIRTSLKY